MTVLCADGLCLPFGDQVPAVEQFCMKLLIKRCRRSVGFRENWPVDVCLTKGPKLVSAANAHVCALMCLTLGTEDLHGMVAFEVPRRRYFVRFYPIGVKFRTLTRKYFE